MVVFITAKIDLDDSLRIYVIADGFLLYTLSLSLSLSVAVSVSISIFLSCRASDYVDYSSDICNQKGTVKDEKYVNAPTAKKQQHQLYRYGKVGWVVAGERASRAAYQ